MMLWMKKNCNGGYRAGVTVTVTATGITVTVVTVTVAITVGMVTA